MLPGMLKRLPVVNAIRAPVGRILAERRRRDSNRRWRDVDHVLANLATADESTYRSLKHFEEPEHQIGRFLNMRKIVREIESSGYPGDFVEFGTWQGLGLCLLDRCFQASHDRRYVGIDSFEGLPESSTVWVKGQFNDTSTASVRATLDRHLRRSSRYTLIQGWFADQKVAEELDNATRQAALVHFDADLKSSTLDALRVSERFLTDRKTPLFFMFDDWGCHPDEVPDAFYEWLEPARKRFGFQERKIGSTRFTRYYRLEFA